MRCFTTAASAPWGSKNTFGTMWTGSVLLACLLLIAGFTDAARTPQQREQRNPYVILPPGPTTEYDGGRPAQDLGERSFVSTGEYIIAVVDTDVHQSLRHIYHHGSHRYPHLHRYLDVWPDDRFRTTHDYGETYEEAPTILTARAATTNIQRLAKRKPADIDNLLQHAQVHGEAATLPPSAWTVDEAAGPNITDRKTILSFAKMAANAYVQDRTDKDWKDVKGGFNYTDDFGWEADGLRGHIFADETNKTVVVGLKGTSVPWFDYADTVDRDRVS